VRQSRIGAVRNWIAEMRYAIKQFPLVHKALWWLRRKACQSMMGWLRNAVRPLSPRSGWIGLPRGWYSSYELLCRRPPLLEGRVILEDQGTPSLPEHARSLLAVRREDQEQPWPVFWTRSKNARLVGSSLGHLNERKQLCVESAYRHLRVKQDPAYNYLVMRPPVHLSGAWTSIVSHWVPNNEPKPYGDWLLDALPRLALLHEFPSDVRIIVPAHQLRYRVESLRLLGVLDRCRWTPEKHLLVEDYYFSSPTTMVACYNPYGVDFLRASFLPFANGAPATPARFYLRRTGSARNVANEPELLDFFRAGLEHHRHTATLGLVEQIQLFAGAEAICAIHGSGLANAVWCPAGCQVVELFADAYLAGCHEWICHCVKAGHHAVICPSDHKLNALVDLARLRELLQSLRIL